MANDDTDDIFKDFEHKVESKEEVHHVHKKETHETHKSHEEKLSEEELLKTKYEKAEQVLKHKYKKEKEVLEEKKKKEAHVHGEIPHRQTQNIERVAFVAVILVLVVYVGIDLAFYHGDSAGEDEDQTITAAAVNEQNEADETGEVMKEVGEQDPVKEEVKVEEKKQLSGRISLIIDKVYTEVPDAAKDLGYINKVAFTIDNGKETSLKPVLLVYAYDSELDEIWETKSRGKYTGTAIKSGEKQTGTIELSPKTFINLDLEKSIRLTLNDTDTGYITSVNKDITIS